MKDIIFKWNTNSDVKNLDNEIWKETEYKGYYVSNYGRIKSMPNTTRNTIRILTNTIDIDGYAGVTINGKRIKVHRLVAKAFVENPNNYNIINHKDENKTNNNADNLEWCDTKYNVTYSCGKKIKQIDPNTLKVIEIFDSASDAARKVNGANAHILDVCNKKYKCKRAYGYIWRFIDDNDYNENRNEGNKKQITIVNKFNDNIILFFDTVQECADYLGVGITAVSNCINGRSKSCKGYRCYERY